MLGVLLTDLSKAFDCLFHELLAAKLSAYEVDISAVRFLYDYLTNRKQRTIIEDHYSSCKDLIFGVPQGSISEPQFFSIYLYETLEITKKAT